MKDKCVSIKVKSQENLLIDADGFELFEDVILIVDKGEIKGCFNRESVESVLILDGKMIVDRVDLSHLSKEIVEDILLFEQLKDKHRREDHGEDVLRCEGVLQALKGIELKLGKGVNR